MAHITPAWPPNGSTNWGIPLNAGLTTVTNQINNHDDQLASLGGSTNSAVTLPTDGTTDIGALIQSAYDTGNKFVVLQRNVTYAWNTPVFLDANDKLGGLVIVGNKATILLGSGLPTTSWSRDGSTKFAIFPNTLRTALSGGSVTVNDSTRATGTGGALRTLVVRDVTIDGNTANVGFAFSNRTPTTFEDVVVYRMRVGATWWDYADENTFINCYSRAGSGPSNQVVFEQYQTGDGLTVVGGKADSSVLFASVKTCRGATFTGLVTASLSFQDCSGINIIGMHQEGQQSTSTMLQIKSSQVTLTGCTLYENWSASVPTISIDDSEDTSIGTELILDNVISNQIYTQSTYGTAYSPFIDVIAAQDNTRIIARNLQGMATSTGIAGTWVAGTQPYITASGSSSMTTALATPRSQAALASGTFTLSKFAGSTWTLATHGDSLYVSKNMAVPVITQITTETGFVGGTLSSGTTYSYAAAWIDAQGNMSAVSAEVAKLPGSTQMTRLLINSNSGSGQLIVWRKAASTGASTAPDAYVILTMRPNRAYFYDTGAYLAGRVWLTTSIPTPSSTNSTLDQVLTNGGNLLGASGTKKITVSTTSPSSPSVGDLWVDTN